VLGRALAIAMGAMFLATFTAAVLVEVPAAAASSGPTWVQSAGASGGNATEGSSVAITATLGEPCSAGGTLVAFVTIAQQVGSAGAVAIAPQGWTRLYEHAPSGHVAAYHGWFALSGCSGVTAATFTVTAPGNPDGTAGSVVLSEYAGLPSSLVVDYATNAGDGGGDTSGSLTASTSAPAGTVVLAALSLYAPSTVTSTPAGWNSAGTAGGSLPASTWWQKGGGGDPSASFTWSPAAAAWEMTMLILSAGPAGGPPNVVQEASGAFESSASWSVALPEGVTAGDALVATILTDTDRGGSGFEASTVKGGGITWEPVIGYGTSGGGTAEVWAGFASAGTTGSPTVTAGLGASADGQMVIAEVSGIAGIDTTSTASGNGADPTATSLTPTAGDFVVAAMAAPGTTLWIHPGPLWSTFSMSTTPAYGAEWQSSAPAAATAPQWTDFSSAPWVAVVAAFTTGPGAPPPAPAVTGLSPTSGSTGGGTTVVITGTSFTGATAVMVGANAATSFTVNSPTSITATFPGGAAGTVDVTVTTPVGTSAPTGADEFTYVPPQQQQPPPPPPPPPPSGYDLVGQDGGVFVFPTGQSGGYYGSLPGLGVHVNDIVGMVPSPDDKGYFLVGQDGGVFAFGDAPYLGSLPGLGISVHDIKGIVPTRDNRGYFLVGQDGGVFAFGDAGFLGSLPGEGIHINDVIGIAATPSDLGYWVVAGNGTVYSFGNASNFGSAIGTSSPVSGIAATPDGGGYWIVTQNGGVFTFGDAGYFLSLPALDVKPSRPIIGLVPTSDEKGYWLIGGDGGIFAFGDAGFVGSLPGLGIHVTDIVGAVPTSL